MISRFQGGAIFWKTIRPFFAAAFLISSKPEIVVLTTTAPTI